MRFRMGFQVFVFAPLWIAQYLYWFYSTIRVCTRSRLCRTCRFVRYARFSIRNRYEVQSSSGRYFECTVGKRTRYSTVYYPFVHLVSPNWISVRRSSRFILRNSELEEIFSFFFPVSSSHKINLDANRKQPTKTVKSIEKLHFFPSTPILLLHSPEVTLLSEICM